MTTKFAVETIFKAVDNMTGPLNKMIGPLNRIGRSAKALKKPFDTIGRGVIKLSKVAGVAGVAAVSALTVALNKSADQADRLAKLSRRLDFDIESLQQWQFIAEQSGVSTELLNKSLGAFSKRLGEAKGGTGPLVSGLKKLNPELLEQLNATRSIPEAFDLYIKAIRSADSATEKAALANAAFSRSGLELVQISHNSEKALSEMMREMTENGLITQEAAEGAEDYKDAMNSLRRSIRGAIQVAVLPLAKTLTPLVQQFREFVVTNKDLIRQKLVKFVESAVSAFRRLIAIARESDVLHKVLSTTSILVGKLASFAKYLAENWDKVATAVKWAVGVYITLQATVLLTNAAMAAAVIGTKAIAAAQWAWAAATGAMNAVLATARAAMLALNIAMYANPIGLVIAAIAALTAVVVAAIVYWDDITAALGRAWSAFKEAGIWADVVVGAIALMTGPIGWLTGAAILITKHWKPIKGFFAELWGGVVEIFNSAINWIMGAIDSVIGAVERVINAGRAVTDFIGITDEDAEAPPSERGTPPLTAGAGVAGPMDGVMQTLITGQSSAEVTLRNETNAKAEVSQQRGPMNLQIANSGAF